MLHPGEIQYQRARRAAYPSPLPLSRKGRGERSLNGHARTPSPHPHPLADAGTQSCKLAEASLLGEGWGEGASSMQTETPGQSETLRQDD